MSDPTVPTPDNPPPPPPRPHYTRRARWEHRLLELREFVRRHLLPLCLGGLIFTFVCIYFAHRIFILIGPGEAGVLFRRLTDGTDMDTIYGEGMSIIAPWNKMFIYTVRVQEHTEMVEALSSNGLTIRVTVSMRYHPEYKNLPFLHQKIGPDYFKRVVLPEVTAGVREVIGKYLPQELYTLKTSDIANGIIQSADRSLHDKFIALDDVNIVNIRLPALVTSAIESKLTQEQMAEEYKFRIARQEQEKVRLRTEAEGISQYNTLVNQSITPELLRFRGIEATLELSKSPNSKVIVIGSGQNGLPLILNTEGAAAPAAPPPAR